MKLGRRSLLLSMLTALLPWRLCASPEQMQQAISDLFGDRPIRTGRVRLDMPPLVENGNAVPLTVTIDSTMRDADRVVAIHVFNEKNPQPHVISVTFGPSAGRASFSTRIKLADSQKITAIAELQDGSLWRGEASAVVTVAACIEEVR